MGMQSWQKCQFSVFVKNPNELSQKLDRVDFTQSHLCPSLHPLKNTRSQTKQKFQRALYETFSFYSFNLAPNYIYSFCANVYAEMDAPMFELNLTGVQTAVSQPHLGV